MIDDHGENIPQGSGLWPAAESPFDESRRVGRGPAIYYVALDGMAIMYLFNSMQIVKRRTFFFFEAGRKYFLGSLLALAIITKRL